MEVSIEIYMFFGSLLNLLTISGPVATVTSTTYGVSNPPYPVDAPMQQPTPGFNIGGPNPPYPTHPAQPMPGVYPPAPGKSLFPHLYNFVLIFYICIVPPMGYPPMQPMGMFLSMGCSGIIFAFE